MIPAELFKLRDYVPLKHVKVILEAYESGGLRAAVMQVRHVGYELKKEAAAILLNADASKEVRAAAEITMTDGVWLIEWAQAYRLAHPFAI